MRAMLGADCFHCFMTFLFRMNSLLKYSSADGLMGSDRDLTAEEKDKNRRTFDDPNIDTSYLCNCR